MLMSRQPIEMQALKTYSIVAAERLNKLLGDVLLATKAKQMSEALYTRALGQQDLTAEPKSSGIFTSP